MRDEWVVDLERDSDAGCLDGGYGGSVGTPPPIFRVPEKERKKNAQAYHPELVSIGPYHHGEERLRGMEKHKRRALLHFLRRSNQTPEECLGMLRSKLAPPPTPASPSQTMPPGASKMMSAYDNLDEKCKDDEELFLKMMLMDGCFIVEIMLTYAGVVDDYDEDDPIFSHRGQLYKVPSIRRDLLLIENQIPLLVLQTLFPSSGAKIKGCENDDGLVKCLLEFLPQYLGKFQHGSLLEQSLHILDFYRQRLIFGEENSAAVVSREERSEFHLKKFGAPKIHCASELRDFGILVRRHWHQPTSTFSIRALLRGFRDRQVLDLPELTVDKTTESVFLNVMALESFLYPTAEDKFSSYVYLMSDLMASERHAFVLSCQLCIIRNGLGTEQALLDLFQRLSSSNNFLPDYRLFLLRMMINDYCEGTWNRFRASIKSTYFKNPWSQISVFSAIFIFALTIIQTLYAVYPNSTGNKHAPD